MFRSQKPIALREEIKKMDEALKKQMNEILQKDLDLFFSGR